MNQQTLLNKPDNSFRGTYINFNFPSPYLNKEASKDVQKYNWEFELSSTPLSTFTKTPFLREPSTNNPFMNVTPVDYDAIPLFSDYNRYEYNETLKDKQVGNKVENDFNKNLIRDPDSMFWDRINSQRQFVSVPVGSVPNDQGEFANWLYGIKHNCKAGSIYANYGLEYTDDSLMCTGFSLPVMTNKGTLR